jgi:two-component system nitrogen regulation response regulator GlnG
LRQRGEQLPVIVITEHGTPLEAIEASRLGAEFFTKPLEMTGPELDRLRRTLDRVVENARLMTEPVRLPGDPEATVAGKPGCEPMATVYREIGQAANKAHRNCPVLFLGELGTGKDLMARALFKDSARKDRPFLKVRCAAFPEKELEGELFGYKGDGQQQVGVFEKAGEGAVLLDDIDGTSETVQEKILQLIDEGVVDRGGRGIKVKSDVWVIACAHRPFPSKLYYRFAKISLPLLRDRGEDVDELADYFLKQAAAEANSCVRSFAEEAREKLRRHSWPANVYELEHLIRTAVRRCRGRQITAADLQLGPPDRVAGTVATYLQRAIATALESGQTNLFPFLNNLLVRELVWLTYTAADNNLTATAERTGLPASEVRRILGIDLPPEPIQYVTLDQMAAIVNRTKKTLENRKRCKRNPLPPPDVEGGGGKPDEWKWTTVRSWLEQEFGRQLPEHFPSDRSQ